ncbi:MAG: protein-tyrosine-phosphatase [Pseudonocardiaceae bacterium]|nr:protein-tyrosine-phosphatase [Pseudonocardiaceae bacterium]
MANFRDLGGLPTGDGRRTCDGVLYRSDAPHRGDPPPTTAVSWPPELVLDLREAAEQADHPLAGVADVMGIPLLAGPHAVDWRRLPRLEELYLGSLRRAGERIAELLGLLARTTGPALVHCAAGKDRTGVLVAVLLRAAGVTRDAVVDDYLRTDRNVAAVLTRMSWDLTVLDEEDRLRAQHLAGTSAAALTAVLDVLDAAPGGPAGWASSHGASDEALGGWTRMLVG